MTLSAQFFYFMKNEYQNFALNSNLKLINVSALTNKIHISLYTGINKIHKMHCKMKKGVKTETGILYMIYFLGKLSLFTFKEISN